MREAIIYVLIASVVVVALWRPLIEPVLTAIINAWIKTLQYRNSRNIEPREGQYWEGLRGYELWVLGTDSTGVIVTNREPNMSCDDRRTYVIPHKIWPDWLKRHGLRMLADSINIKYQDTSKRVSNDQKDNIEEPEGDHGNV